MYYWKYSSMGDFRLGGMLAPLAHRHAAESSKTNPGHLQKATRPAIRQSPTHPVDWIREATRTSPLMQEDQAGTRMPTGRRNRTEPSRTNEAFGHEWVQAFPSERKEETTNLETHNQLLVE
ncbi:hypothetical protein ANO14919_131410 [Xylariales sp. No.14919]|nr:hypothetical protein ANO14919_131410 [Xylariales sp. No.14919]